MLKKFPSDARVVFIGDSITAENLTLQWIIKSYKSLDDYDKIRFFNCGVAGGTAEFACEIYAEDVKRYRPTHAVVSFGINDSMRDLLNEKRSKQRLEALFGAYEKYKKSLSKLIDMLLSDGVEVVLCTPTPYDEYLDSDEPALPGGYALMQGYAQYVRSLAAEKQVFLYDAYEKISHLLAEEYIISADRIHPDSHGYYALAREFLKEQGIDVGEETELPSYFKTWHSYVARLRMVLAAECMLVRGLGMTYYDDTEKKMAGMLKKVESEDWGNPVLERFYRAYVIDKPFESELYRLVDETYENEIA